MPSRTALVVALCLSAPSAFAQSLQCHTCADCTQLLAAPDARVELTADLTFSGNEPCLDVRGANARFNGLHHTIRAQPAAVVAVRVSAAGANLRNLQLAGADTGLLLQGARDVTAYDITVDAAVRGVGVERSANVRLERVHTRGGHAGVSFGARDDGRCDEGRPMASPGAVLLRSTVEGADVGVAACDARPVLSGNTIVRNGVGVWLAAPTAIAGPGGASPWDACACAPGLDGVHGGTVTLYSSGCGGCQVHEGWMPSLHRRGADIVVRESGNGTEEAQQRFDRFGWRCMPGVMDSLGIPGCVPNYGCAATGAFAKRRDTDGSLSIDVPLHSEEDVLHFAQTCAAAGSRYARGARCVPRAVADNTVCDNRDVDLRATGDAARAGGADNRCGRVDGWRDGSSPGCASPCGQDGVVRTPPPEAHHEPSLAPTPAPAPPVEAPQAPATPPTAATPATPPGAPATGSPWALVALLAAGLGAVWWRGRTR